MLKSRKVKKILTLLLMGVTLLAVGCAGGSTPSSKPTNSSTPPAKPGTVTSTSPTSGSTPPASTTAASKTTAASPRVTKWTNPPAMQIDTKKTYYATMETSLGTFKIELFASESPVTVNNFVFLAKQNYFNGIIFHRIIKDFMIQTGDPTGTGSGGPGYRFGDELPVKHQYEPGIVAMANAGPNTNGSQFFVCTGSSSKNLNSSPNYTQFGRVVEGMDIVLKIASVKVVSNGRETSQPADPPLIKGITITEK
jgi:cyclophilin family peptidyl-prolyl cis-trans isomerase